MSHCQFRFATYSTNPSTADGVSGDEPHRRRGRRLATAEAEPPREPRTRVSSSPSSSSSSSGLDVSQASWLTPPSAMAVSFSSAAFPSSSVSWSNRSFVHAFSVSSLASSSPRSSGPASRETPSTSRAHPERETMGDDEGRVDLAAFDPFEQESSTRRQDEQRRSARSQSFYKRRRIES